MGLFTGLLLLPFSAPTKGLLFVFDQIKERVNAEISDPGKVEEELTILSLRLDMGEITNEEYDAQEAALLDRLNAIHEHLQGSDESTYPPEEAE
ncbi:MAG: gas vesicle protein GvpG [Chloroflexi bacterium]|nr:gas vesicle protein GvpG [Chloroflexota bacterium]